MKQEKTRNLYIEPRADGRPARKAKDVLDMLHDAVEIRHKSMINVGTRPGKGRTKLVVTITVEEVAA